MKFVGRKAFLSLPAGTIFSKWMPDCYDPPCRKGETLWHEVSPSWGDFWYLPLAYPVTDDDHLTVEIAQGEYRDGCFDVEQIFAIWERADLEIALSQFQQTLNELAEREKADATEKT